MVDLLNNIDFKSLGRNVLDFGSQLGLSTLLDDLLETGTEDILRPITDFRDLGVGLNAGGLQGQLTDGVYTVSPTNATRSNLIGDMQTSLGQYASNLRGQRENLTPGFGALTRARVDSLENAKRKAIGDLRENLARRRVAGSSFAQDAESRLAREYDIPIAETGAQSFLQELQLFTNLSRLEAQANIQAAETALNELNRQLNVGLNNVGSITGAMANLASIESQVLGQLASGQANNVADLTDNILTSLGIR
ncbi:MAG TPA: hypothetical protein DCL39_15935 [Alteromonas macleodii]|nr:hypothetical protein [Alteromonas macleodii]HAG30952.1 hypothetical protein [Alteromonas macleodii]HAM18070.1 hypothetical protein [Alteromonas macleodii]HAX27885.1 hypothetical protein [Alteromonas macleodii]|tara:strand:- start:397 stop:1149 length:753 start_codon:yes stop_codon:yes gene_type:complete